MSKGSTPTVYGGGPFSETPWTRLSTRYGEPHRHHHTMKHIWEMLSIFSAGEWPLSLVESHAVLIAIWFHDAIYDPKASDNEEQSAKLAQSELVPYLLPGDDSQMLMINVKRLIRSTAAHDPTRNDERVLSDLDLAILGAKRSRYQEYMDDIQREYDFVPWEIYITKRAEIMQGFLDRPQIFYYLTDLEEPARANITWELELLALGW